MNKLIIFGLMISMLPEENSMLPEESLAPKDTCNPSACVKRLGNLFHNCSFIGIQKQETNRPVGPNHTYVLYVKGKACEDAVVFQYKKQTTNRVNEKGQPLPDAIEYREWRWIRNEVSLQADISIREPNRWPLETVPETNMKVNEVIVFSPKDPRNQALSWREILISDFAEEVSNLGLTFADMVVEGGRYGYKFDKATWSSIDRSQITYRFKSADYGITVITLAKQNREWMPTSIHLIRDRDHKIGLDEILGRDVRVRDLQKFENSQPVINLDRLEDQYEIKYFPQPAGDISLPKSLKHTETRFFISGGRSVVTELLEFSELRCGNVSCDEVRGTMLAIPNGTKVVTFEPEYKNIDMVWKDGKPVKWIDVEAVNVSQSLTFSTKTRIIRILVFICLVITLGILLYYRFRVQKRAS